MQRTLHIRKTVCKHNHSRSVHGQKNVRSMYCDKQHKRHNVLKKISSKQTHHVHMVSLKSARTEGAVACVSGWHSQSQHFNFNWGGPLSAKNPECLKVVESRAQKKRRKYQHLMKVLEQMFEAFLKKLKD